MADLGVTELGRDRIIRAAYDAVGIITFFTAGEPEVRGWNLERARTPSRPPARSTPTWPRDSSAPRSPRTTTGTPPAPSRKPRPSTSMRLEGKDYIVKDGDIIYFRSAL